MKSSLNSWRYRRQDLAYMQSEERNIYNPLTVYSRCKPLVQDLHPCTCPANIYTPSDCLMRVWQYESLTISESENEIRSKWMKTSVI